MSTYCDSQNLFYWVRQIEENPCIAVKNPNKLSDLETLVI